MKIFENVAIKLVSFKNRNYCLFSIIFFCILHRLKKLSKFRGYCDHVNTTTPLSTTGNLFAGHKKEYWKKKKKTEAKTTLRLL